MKKALKFLGALLGLLVLLVIALVVFVMLTLKPNLPGSEFAVQPVPADGGRNVIVFGATGKLGTEIVRDLREHGDQVTAFVRSSSDRSQLEPLGVNFAVGDVMDPVTVQAAFEAGSFDAAIAAISGLSVPDLDRQGNINVADAAVAAGVQRVILISTVGAGDSRNAAPLISRLALSKILPQKTAAEEHFRASGLNYTIIRPGGLPPGVVPTGRGILSDEPATMGFIKRPDLARLLLGVLYDDRTIGKTLAAVDPGLERPWAGGDP
ncbi:MAG: NAD-dependent epimerase/dehydratase family protein [Chromatiales bacterium]|jgi:uncharacterized protein YbjT (DUF2867 family)|nr:MAG: NAD-dependent epimerase/dehydratase family protein [Chromatiales bacterium]